MENGLVPSEMEQDILEAILRAKDGAPNKFQSFWEMDEEDVDEATEEEIQNNPNLRILWAAENNHIDIATSMLDDNIDLIQATDLDGYTPLHRASYNGHLNMVQMLISKKADIIHATTNEGWQPIHSAARWNQSHIVTFLVTHGADINSQTHGGQTPLHLAASELDSRETLEYLLTHKDIDANVVNSIGDTARTICERTGPLHVLFEATDECVNKLR